MKILPKTTRFILVIALIFSMTNISIKYYDISTENQKLQTLLEKEKIKQNKYCKKISHGDKSEQIMCTASFYDYLDLNILRRELYMMQHGTPKIEVY